MNPKITSALTAVLLASLPGLARAQNFSADVVYVAPAQAAASATAPAPHEPSKIFVSKSKLRLETRGITGTILITDWDERATVALFPQKNAYQPLVSGPSEYFPVHDPENACPDWQSASESKLNCEKVGHEQIEGRTTVKYQNKSATLAAPLSAVWIDPALNFVVKWEAKDAAAELRNINKEEKVSAALFEVPAGYDLLKPKKKAAKGPGK